MPDSDAVKIKTEVNMIKILEYMALGLVAGSLSGTIGIGGGIILVPALVLLFEFSQHQAQGTSLAIMPLAIFAAYTYYRAGHVDVKAAGFICAGFVIGGLIGAKFAVSLPKDILQKVFGAVLLTIGIYMIFKK